MSEHAAHPEPAAHPPASGGHGAPSGEHSAQSSGHTSGGKRHLDMWGNIKDRYASGKAGTGGIVKGITGYASKEYISGVGDGIASALIETPTAGVMSVVQPLKKDVGELPKMLKESLGGYKLEIFKDMAIPVAYTVGHIREKIIGNFKLFHPIESFFKMGWGVATTPYAFLSGLGTAITHLPGDALALYPSIVGASLMTVSSITQQASSAVRRFGQGMLVISDTIEKACNNFFVSPPWRESRDSEYDNLNRYGREFGMAH